MISAEILEKKYISRMFVTLAKFRAISHIREMEEKRHFR
jgi:hypothetical protein